MAPQTTAVGGGGVGEEAVEEAGTLRHRHNAAKNGGGGEEDGDVASSQSQLLAGGEGEGGKALSVERAYAEQAVPSWREQLTVRAFMVSFFLAIMFGILQQVILGMISRWPKVESMLG